MASPKRYCAEGHRPDVGIQFCGSWIATPPMEARVDAKELDPRIRENDLVLKIFPHYLHT